MLTDGIIFLAKKNFPTGWAKKKGPKKVLAHLCARILAQVTFTVFSDLAGKRTVQAFI